MCNPLKSFQRQSRNGRDNEIRDSCLLSPTGTESNCTKLHCLHQVYLYIYTKHRAVEWTNDEPTNCTLSLFDCPGRPLMAGSSAPLPLVTGPSFPLRRASIAQRVKTRFAAAAAEHLQLTNHTSADRSSLPGATLDTPLPPWFCCSIILPSSPSRSRRHHPLFITSIVRPLYPMEIVYYVPIHPSIYPFAVYSPS